jgi:hypothetical protein
MGKKSEKLAELEGYDSVEDLIAIAMTDSVCPGICMNPLCNYTVEVEPDQREGYCEICDDNNVQSILIIEGII